jgi:hypothetical protein
MYKISYLLDGYDYHRNEAEKYQRELYEILKKNEELVNIIEKETKIKMELKKKENTQER